MTDTKSRAKAIILDFVAAIRAARDEDGVLKYFRDLVLEACEEGASNAIRAYTDALDMDAELADLNVAFSQYDVNPDNVTAVSKEADNVARALEVIAKQVRCGEIADPFAVTWDGIHLPSVTIDMGGATEGAN